MKIIATIISPKLIINSLLSLFIILLQKPKTRMKFLASCWAGNKKYSHFIFIVSHGLLQSHFFLFVFSFMLKKTLSWVFLPWTPLKHYFIDASFTYWKAYPKVPDYTYNIKIYRLSFPSTLKVKQKTRLKSMYKRRSI